MEEEDNNSRHSSSSPPLFMRIASSSDSEDGAAAAAAAEENSSEIHHPDAEAAAELIVLNDDDDDEDGDEVEEGEIVSDDDLQVVYVSSFGEEENNEEEIVDENDEDSPPPPDDNNDDPPNPPRKTEARSRAELKERRRRKRAKLLLRMANNNGDERGGEKSTTTSSRGTKKRRKKVQEEAEAEADEEEVIYLSTTVQQKNKQLTKTEKKKMRKKGLYPDTEECWAKRRKLRKERKRLRAKRAAKTLLEETTTTTTNNNNAPSYNLRSQKTTTAEMTTTRGGSALSQSYDQRCLREIVQSAVDKLLVRGGGRGEAEEAGNFVVLVAGPRNAGKSTMCRKLANHLLGEGLTTYHLECDPGQTEFTPPGCLALTEILERVEGLPFSHLQTPLRCKFFGETSPANRVDDYVRCVRRLAEEFDQITSSGNGNDSRSPGCLIVNTAGWIHGAGLASLREIVDATKPDYVVFLDSQRSKLEAMSISDAAYDDLRSNGAASHRSFRRIQGRTAADYDDVDQQVHQHFRPPPTNRPSAQREAALLAYFGGHHQSPESESAAMSSSTNLLLARSILRTRPYAVSMCRVWAGVVHAQSPGQVPASRLMSVLNGSLVALCERPQYDEEVEDEDDDQSQRPRRHWMDDPTLPMRMDHHDQQSSTADVECLGFGIIRGIDLESRTFYVVSPVPGETLSRVNVILKGDVGLPPALFLTQKAARPGITAAPYVARGRGEWLALTEETLDLRTLDDDKKEARRRRKMEQRVAAIRESSTGGPNVWFRYWPQF